MLQYTTLFTSVLEARDCGQVVIKRIPYRRSVKAWSTFRGDPSLHILWIGIIVTFYTELEWCLSSRTCCIEPERLSWLMARDRGSRRLWLRLELAFSWFSAFWFMLLVLPSRWFQSCICPYVFWEFHCALLLVHVDKTVCGSFVCQILVLWLNDCLPLLWVIFVKQLGEYPEFCSVMFHTERCSLLMQRCDDTDSEGSYTWDRHYHKYSNVQIGYCLYNNNKGFY